MLGADTRSTNGDTVADKNCEKIHYIAPNIYCCGAGTAADTEAVTGAAAAVMRTSGLGLRGSGALTSHRCPPQAWCPPRWSCTATPWVARRAW